MSIATRVRVKVEQATRSETNMQGRTVRTPVYLITFDTDKRRHVLIGQTAEGHGIIVPTDMPNT